MTNEQKAQELLRLYNEYEQKLFSGDKSYQEVPENAWGDLEAQLEDLGYRVVSRPQGYSRMERM
jgi:hypothetical protein